MICSRHLTSANSGTNGGHCSDDFTFCPPTFEGAKEVRLIPIIWNTHLMFSAVLWISVEIGGNKKIVL